MHKMALLQYYVFFSDCCRSIVFSTNLSQYLWFKLLKSSSCAMFPRYLASFSNSLSLCLFLWASRKGLIYEKPKEKNRFSFIFILLIHFLLHWTTQKKKVTLDHSAQNTVQITIGSEKADICNATTGFSSMKWCLRKECSNPKLMICHYPHVGGNTYTVGMEFLQSLTFHIPIPQNSKSRLILCWHYQFYKKSVFRWTKQVQMHTFKPFWGFIRKFLLRSSNMIVFLLLYPSNFPQIMPSGLVCKKLSWIMIRLSWPLHYY